MNRALLNLGLLVLATALVSLALWQLRSRATPAVAAPDRSDYVLREFELVTLNDAGKESFTVRGPYLQRDVAGRSLSLVQPRFSFPREGGGRWNASAEAAWVNPGADEVHLLRAVELRSPPDATGLVSTMRTERLVVLPEVEQARSDRRVTVTQGDSILEGTGLRADLKAKKVDLLTKVKGRYVPR